MAKHFRTLSGASYGSIFAGAVSHGFDYDHIKSMHKHFPGDGAMRKQAEWERASWFRKVITFPWMTRGLQNVYGEWVKYFRSIFAWNRVTHARRVFLCFCLSDDVGRLVGTPHCSFLDYIRLLKGVSRRMPIEKLAEIIRPYYASDDGVYRLEPDGFVRRISHDVIPMADAILASFANPLLGEFKVKFNGKWHRTIDGGIANNHANLPFNGSGLEYQQVICDEKIPTADCLKDRMPLSAYHYHRTKPARVDCFRAKTEKLAFFEFPDEVVDYEFDGRKYADPILDSLAIRGGAADGMAYAPLYKAIADMV
jgi:hypothetical protein